MRNVIYTALFGNYDKLNDPPQKYSEFDFICFTDNQSIRSDVWQIEYVKPALTPILSNRRVKILAHEYVAEYDTSIYIDSNIRIRKDPFPLVQKYLEIYDLTVPKHFSRNCIYDEATAVIREGKANDDDVVRLMDRLRRDEYPSQYGLGENNVILRNHNAPGIVRLMEEWWDFVITYAPRDQLSLLYLLWKYPDVKYILMPETARNGHYFEMEPHSSANRQTFWSWCWTKYGINHPNSVILRSIRNIRRKLDGLVR